MHHDPYPSKVDIMCFMLSIIKLLLLLLQYSVLPSELLLLSQERREINVHIHLSTQRLPDVETK